MFQSRGREPVSKQNPVTISENQNITALEVTLRFCSACRSQHLAFHFGRLLNPETINGVEYQFAGICPDRAMPVFMRFEED